MPLPIFVIGKHRSGTTWLGNLLCEHPLIAGIQHSEHFGIHESVYFTHIINRYGDLSQKVNFTEFVEVMGTSNYFRIAGATKEFLYSLYPSTYEDIFRSVMDQFAIRAGAKFWLEKSPVHTLKINEMAKYYPDAKFISITRNIEDTIASNLKMRDITGTSKKERMNARYNRIGRLVHEWTFYNKMIYRFNARSDKMMVITYEDLRSNTESILKIINSFIGVEYDERIINQSFKQNTSFKSKQDREKELSTSEIYFIKFVKVLYKLVPLELFIIRRKINIRRRRGNLPGWFFNLSPFFNESSTEKE